MGTGHANLVRAPRLCPTGKPRRGFRTFCSRIGAGAQLSSPRRRRRCSWLAEARGNHGLRRDQRWFRRQQKPCISPPATGWDATAPRRATLAPWCPMSKHGSRQSARCNLGCSRRDWHLLGLRFGLWRLNRLGLRFAGRLFHWKFQRLHDDGSQRLTDLHVLAPFGAPAAYLPNGESPKNVSVENLPVVRSWVVTVVTSLRRLMVTVLSFPIATVKEPIFSPLLLM